MAWSKAKIEEARRDILRLEDATDGGGLNFCYNDGYYARSLVDKYQMSIGELKRIVGKPTITKKIKWSRANAT